MKDYNHKTWNEHFGYKLINGIYKYKDCPHCGDEWEYQCGECEEEEEQVSFLYKKDWGMDDD